MDETASARRVRQVLAQVRPLAATYYQLTGKPLGATGEIVEYVAAETLGLDPAPPRRAGYDALRKAARGNERIRIKGRAYGPGAKASQRLGTIKRPARQIWLEGENAVSMRPQRLDKVIATGSNR